VAAKVVAAKGEAITSYALVVHNEVRAELDSIAVALPARVRLVKHSPGMYSSISDALTLCSWRQQILKVSNLR
jgi:hypothetical protein